MTQVGVQANPLLNTSTVRKPRTLQPKATLEQTDDRPRKARSTLFSNNFIPKRLTNTVVMLAVLFLLLKFTIFR